jgi:alpha-L-rhamnosidase
MSRREHRGGRVRATAATMLVVLAGSAALLSQAATARPPEAPAALTVGDRARPLAVEGAPLFGWLPQDADGGEEQTAYQIRVWRESDGELVWDSGRVASSQQSYVRYAGPPLASATSHTWSVRTWDRDGEASPWAPTARFDTALEASDWQASWIRRDATEPDDYTLARKQVEIGSSPVVRARAYVSAYHQYRLYLNGDEVDDGPAFSYPGEGYYQATDVTDAVQAGSPLAIGVIYHWYGGGQGRPAADRRLLAQIVVEHADGSRDVVGTDGSWRVRRASQWLTGSPRRNSDAGDYVERIDARQEPVGWKLPGYDAGGAPWTDATVLGAHPAQAGAYATLTGQEPRLAKQVVSPVSVQTLPDGAVVADFGKVIPARPVIHFQDGAAGRVIDMQTSFLLTADGHADTSQLGQQRSNMTARYIQRGGVETFEPYLHWGWRYLEIRSPGPGEELGPGDIEAIVEHTDAPSGEDAEFTSSDATVNAVWELVKRSSIYSVQHQFVDTPTREKGQFLGDAADISYATMGAWFERDATQKAIREFIQSQSRYWNSGTLLGRLNAVYPNGDGRRDIPDYTEMFVNWVWRYYEQTGDRTLLEAAYPVMQGVADYVWRHRSAETGLIHDLEGGSGDYLHGIIDWPPQGRFGYDTATVARTTVNILGVDVFRRVADAARVLDRPAGEYGRYRQREASLRGAINDRLRRADGIYIDGLKADGSQSTHASQHASSYAIAYDVAPPGAYPVLADYIASLGMRQGPMTAHWLLQALADADRPQAVVDLLTNSADLGWANVLARGGTFTWEAWVPEDGIQSMSHGWGSQAAVDILETLLGVRIASPGAADVTIAPPKAGLAWARGSQHTQRGPVTVDWERTSDGLVMLDAEVPDNVSARIEVPVQPGRQYAVTGDSPATFRGVSDGRAVYDVGSGRTHVEPAG